MTEITISNKRLISDNGETKNYVVNVNGTDVRAYESTKTKRFGFNMPDLAKAFNYSTVEEFQASEQWTSFSNQISSNLENNTGTRSNSTIGKVSDILGDAPINITSSQTKTQSGQVWKGWAGINGAIQEPTDIFFWGGGDIDEAVEGKCPITFFANGSGWVANQNISWDELGNLLMRGVFESNKDGNRIIIDPSTRSLKMMYNNLVMFELDFFVNGNYAGARMRSNLYDLTTGELHSYSEMDGGKVSVSKGGSEFARFDAYQDKIWIDADRLSQDRESAYPNEAYMDGEIMKIRRES